MEKLLLAGSAAASIGLLSSCSGEAPIEKTPTVISSPATMKPPLSEQPTPQVIAPDKDGQYVLQNGQPATVCKAILRVVRGQNKVEIITNPVVDTDRSLLERKIVEPHGAIFTKAPERSQKWFDDNGEALKGGPDCQLRSIYNVRWRQPNGHITYELVGASAPPHKPIEASLSTACAAKFEAVHVVVDTNEITAAGILAGLQKAKERCPNS